MYKELQGFEGKRALVTGVGRGIGLCSAEAMAGCCQTNANQSPFAAKSVNLSGTKLTPLIKSSGAVEFEVMA